MTCWPAEPRQFGVIAIREGRETGVDGVRALYEIGCIATLRQVTEHDDGRFDVMTVGTQRFRLLELDESGPYLRGHVDLIDEESGEEAAAAGAVQSVQVAFRAYLDALAAQGAVRVSVPDLPDEPVLLSYLVASSVIVDLSDRQLLLAEPDALLRLTAERMLLAKETGILRSLSSTPARTWGIRRTVPTEPRSEWQRAALRLPPGAGGTKVVVPPTTITGSNRGSASDQAALYRQSHRDRGPGRSRGLR